MGSVVNEEPHSSCQPHVLLFPFMSKGHTIPLLHLAHLLLRRKASVTVITTLANRSFVTQFLQNTTASVVDLPFLTDVPDITAGVESPDQLPSVSSLFYKFASATMCMQPHFESMLETLPHVSFLVSDGFLWWTLHSASKFGIPRLVYYGMSSYATAICGEAYASGIFNGPQPENESVQLNRFPWIRVSKDDQEPEMRNVNDNSLASELYWNVISSTAKSFGMVVNSFYEMEPKFVDHMKELDRKPYYCVGPFCLAREPTNNVISEEQSRKEKWIEWLDKKEKVIYVAFGTQAEISSEQVKEIANGLEDSGVEFMWVMRKGWRLPPGFEERVEDRGIVVREWMDQREILRHKSVKGFLSHCGWNSVLEGICAGVPILAWPMMAEQHFNAKMVEEEIKVGLRVDTYHGSKRGLVRGEGVRNMVKELMEGEKGREVREKVEELGGTAKKAVEEGGSSWRDLDSLIVEACRRRREWSDN